MTDPCTNCQHERDEMGICTIEGNCEPFEEWIKYITTPGDYRRLSPDDQYAARREWLHDYGSYRRGI